MGDSKRTADEPEAHELRSRFDNHPAGSDRLAYESKGEGMVWTALVEDVTGALQAAETARADSAIRSALDDATVAVEKLCNRRFIPVLTTRYFTWPRLGGSSSWRLWLEEDELISLTTLSSGGTVISASGYYLEPANTGPPYSSIEINRGSASAFSVGSTSQRDIAVTGLFGYHDTQTAAGALSGGINSGTTTLTVTDGSLVGVGSLLTIDSERLEVTARTWVMLAQTLQSNLAAALNGVTVAVTTGTSYKVGEKILLDSERMLIVDIAGNNLTVKRAVDGSVLATHSGSTIYVSRSLTVSRGQRGTTAASHLDAAVVTAWKPPAGVRTLTIAEAMDTLEGQAGAYSRTTGSKDGKKDQPGTGLDALRKRVWSDYARKARMHAV